MDFIGRYLRACINVTLKVQAADLQYSPKVSKSSGIKFAKISEMNEIGGGW